MTTLLSAQEFIYLVGDCFAPLRSARNDASGIKQFLVSEKRKSVLAFLFCFAFASIATAQTNLEMAMESYNAREYTVALDFFQKVLKKPAKGTDIADITFKVAECYRYTGKYNEAVAHYKMARDAGYTNPNALYLEAAVYFKQGKFDLAQKALETFLEKVPDDKDATQMLNNCKFVQSVTEEKTVYTFKNETGLNSPYNDYAPVFIKDKMFFTSSRLEEKGQEVYSYDGQGFSAVYASTYTKEDKSWSKPVKVAALTSTVNDGVLSYCEKTKTGYFTRCNENKVKASNLCRIMETTYDEGSGTWSTPKAISLSFVQKTDMNQPGISADGDKLYFAAKMEGGIGGSDIWVMTKSGSQWGEPKNLGGGINTVFDELFPTENNGLLYFSSDGYAGYGGLDIYSSANTNGTWSKPANLKAPFNSSGDDFFITYLKDGSGYLTSNRTGGAGGDDIYNFYLTPVSLTVKGKVTDVDDNRPLAGATIYIATADGHVDSTTTNANGEYIFNLDKDQDYKISVSNPGYFGDSRKLTTQGEKFSKEFSKATGYNYDFAIKKIPKTEIKIDNIYYDYDSYNLREESKPSLDILVKLLEDTPGALVQINSHTDERGKQDYNQKLSENRAKSVVDYLISKGISEGRLTWKGFGFSQPVVKGAKTEEDHQKNRRTAFQVISND
ncbi:MAG: OmpA family protein [Chitinophagales bacterium]|nr:OmpA family protein [Chitinophagales bacterium]